MEVSAPKVGDTLASFWDQKWEPVVWYQKLDSVSSL